MDRKSDFILNRRTMIASAGGALATALLSPRHPAFADDAIQNLRGLSIGIDNYGKMGNLRRAVADARAVGKRIASYGYDVVSLENVGAGALLNGFDRFLATVDDKSAVFLYVACHGLQVNGQNFILPADADGSSSDSLLETSIQTGDLLQQIARQRPRQSIVLFDACRDEPLNVAVSGRQAGFASTNAPGGFYVAYSAGAGQFAIDNFGEKDSDPNGLFVRCLMQQMAPEVLIDDIIKGTRESVIAAARTIGRSQCPAIYDQAGRDFRLDGKPSSPRRQAVRAAARLDGAGVLLLAWQRYDEYSPLPALSTPYSDSKLLGQDFERLGADVTLLLEPSKEELLRACRTLAASGHSQRFVYLAATGFHDDPEAFLLAPLETMPARKTSPNAGKTSATQAGAPGDAFAQIAMVSMTEILEALSTPVPGVPVSPSGPVTRGLTLIPGPKPKIARDTHLLCDFCLTDQKPDELRQLGFLDFSEKLARVKRPYGNVLDQIRSPGSKAAWDLSRSSLFFASSVTQSALDVAPGQSRSPFAIALTNALCQPGLSVGQFADSIRSEVESLTERFQTPMLFCYPETLKTTLIGSA